MSEPQSQSVLVTGGNRGIGLAIAEAFLAQGDRVAVTNRSGGAPDGALDLQCDITDPDAVDAAFNAVEEAHGPVEVLVANAGITHDTLLLRMSEEDWSSVIDTNLTGSFRLAKRAAKGMLRLRRGRIIFISSVVGLLGSPGQVNYAASQGRPGRHGPLARPRARQSRSITANVVAPGFVETDMTAVLTDEQQDGDQGQVPLRPVRRARGGGRGGDLAGRRRRGVRHRGRDPGRRRTGNGALSMDAWAFWTASGSWSRA